MVGVTGIFHFLQSPFILQQIFIYVQRSIANPNQSTKAILFGLAMRLQILDKASWKFIIKGIL